MTDKNERRCLRLVVDLSPAEGPVSSSALDWAGLEMCWRSAHKSGQERARYDESAQEWEQKEGSKKWARKGAH